MQDLKIAIIQSELSWEDKEFNLRHFEVQIEKSKLSDIVVLPEMFSTGFTMNSSSLSESMEGETVTWMKNQASKNQVLLVGSIIINENEKFYNRLIWAFPNGEIQFYDKKHLFRMADEHDYYSSGETKTIVEYKGWKINGLICYDLRFPVWSRNNKLDYDVLIYVANWPKARRTAWIDLLKARAHENLCYVVGVNRVGEDGKGIAYSGDSLAIDFKGNYIVNPIDSNSGVFEFTLSAEDLQSYRQKFPAYMDSDDFELKN